MTATWTASTASTAGPAMSPDFFGVYQELASDDDIGYSYFTPPSNGTPGPRSCGFVTRRKREPGGTLRKFETLTRDAAEAASNTVATFREDQEATAKAKPAANKATRRTTSSSRALPPSRLTTVAQIEHDDAEAQPYSGSAELRPASLASFAAVRFEFTATWPGLQNGRR
ncbi:hypothetical protein MTO96_022881 [Rhipicephalus appendiculatus]